MVKVAALTSGERIPSARFRVRQHIDPLNALGVDVHEHTPLIHKYAGVPGWPRSINSKLAPQFAIWQAIKLGSRMPGLIGSWRSDITWLERELFPGRLTLEGMLSKPLVFDIDDAIWLSTPSAPSAVEYTCRRASVIVAGNEFIADWVSRFASNVRVVPTAIDTDRFQANPCHRADSARFVIGWTGSAPSVPYLEAIEGSLSRFLRAFRDVDLLVIADRPPRFRDIPHERVRYFPWSQEIEALALREVDVGIMPLPDTEWARGKCSFKMLQYMASSIPVVVSPVGMNAELLAIGEIGLSARTDREWYDALSFLRANRDHGTKLGLNGRRVVEEKYSRDVVAQQLAEIFHSLAR